MTASETSDIVSVRNRIIKLVDIIAAFQDEQEVLRSSLTNNNAADPSGDAIPLTEVPTTNRAGGIAVQGVSSPATLVHTPTRSQQSRDKMEAELTRELELLRTRLQKLEADQQSSTSVAGGDTEASTTQLLRLAKYFKPVSRYWASKVERFTRLNESLDRDSLVGACCLLMLGHYDRRDRAEVVAQWSRALSSNVTGTQKQSRTFLWPSDFIDMLSGEELLEQHERITEDELLISSMLELGRTPIIIDRQNKALVYVIAVEKTKDIQIVMYPAQKKYVADAITTSGLRCARPVLLCDVMTQPGLFTDVSKLSQLDTGAGDAVHSVNAPSIPRLYISTCQRPTGAAVPSNFGFVEVGYNEMWSKTVRDASDNRSESNDSIITSLLHSVVKQEAPKVHTDWVQTTKTLRAKDAERAELFAALMKMTQDTFGDATFKDDQLSGVNKEQWEVVAQKVTKIAHIRGISMEVADDHAALQELRDAYVPTATQGALLYRALLDLSAMCPVYFCTLDTFTRIFLTALSRARLLGEVEHHDLAETDRLAQIAADGVTRAYAALVYGMSDIDALLLAIGFIIHVRADAAGPGASVALWTSIRSELTWRAGKRPNHQWITDDIWEAAQSLYRKAPVWSFDLYYRHTQPSKPELLIHDDDIDPIELLQFLSSQQSRSVTALHAVNLALTTPAEVIQIFQWKQRSSGWLVLHGADPDSHAILASLTSQLTNANLETVHAGFRLWIAATPSTDLPASAVGVCGKLRFEWNSNLRNALIGRLEIAAGCSSNFAEALGNNDNFAGMSKTMLFRSVKVEKLSSEPLDVSSLNSGHHLNRAKPKGPNQDKVDLNAVRLILFLLAVYDYAVRDELNSPESRTAPFVASLRAVERILQMFGTGSGLWKPVQQIIPAIYGATSACSGVIVLGCCIACHTHLIGMRTRSSSYCASFFIYYVRYTSDV